MSSEEEKVDTVEELLRKRIETITSFADISKQKFVLSRMLAKYVDGAPNMDLESFMCSMVELNFVGVQLDIESLFARYVDDEGLLNINNFVESTLSMNLREKRDAQKNEGQVWHSIKITTTATRMNYIEYTIWARQNVDDAY